MYHDNSIGAIKLTLAVVKIDLLRHEVTIYKLTVCKLIVLKQDTSRQPH